MSAGANPFRKCAMALALSTPPGPARVDLSLEMRRVHALLTQASQAEHEASVRRPLDQALGVMTVLCAALPGDE